MMQAFLLRLFVLFGFLFILTNSVNANHIVGGEISMKPVAGANRYEVTLQQFWDKNNLLIPTPSTLGNRDERAELYIYKKSTREYIATVEVTYKSTRAIEYQNKACASFRSLNTSQGIYTGIITLSPSVYNDPGGYYIAWERCCRNDDINNIKTPGESGMVFYLEFPPVMITNSSPVFTSPNGQYICSNKLFTMNMSAEDPDGDELRYSLVTPMRGSTGPGSTFGDKFNDDEYALVDWAEGISSRNTIPGPTPLSVDGKGRLRVVADKLGLYVFTVQCEEYRNGKKIGVVRRDFQLLVIDCNDDQPQPPVIQLNSTLVTDVQFCPESPVTLETEQSSEWSYQWQLDGLNLAGETGPTIMVKDTGNYTVVKSYTKKCSRDTSSAQVHVRYSDPVQAIITMRKDTICVGESIDLVANGGVKKDNYIYAWSRNNVALPGNQLTLAVKETGKYTLLVKNEQKGCSGSDTASLFVESVSVNLPRQTSMTEGSTISLVASINPPGAYTYLWTPSEGITTLPSDAEAIVGPLVSTTYVLTVTTSNGCLGADSVLVNVIDKMHIPNSFSPNGDGHNDTFEIFNAKDQIRDIRIFNRWGVLIYNSAGYDRPWDGTYRNTPASAGVYPYIITTENQKYYGTLTLVR